ncbi:hypothetical protein O3M35_008984 [Rhynocoris fuscipes]|uniref:Uncharacterized protein n=1 Tax=Rhynocoris fuscipes TaxID=488301 RepID=A0AAW1D1E6_9HEMI
MLEQSYIQNSNILRSTVFELCRIGTSAHPHTHTDVMPKIVKMGSGRLKTDISVEI